MSVPALPRPFQFFAGPAVLPEPVLRQAAAEMLDWQGSGMSVMEMSHRGKEFISIAARAQQDLRELLAVPPHFRILFMQGGGLGEKRLRADEPLPRRRGGRGGHRRVEPEVGQGSPALLRRPRGGQRRAGRFHQHP